MEFAVPWNIAFFYWINATDTSSVIAINFAKGLAIFTPWIVIAILIVYWLSGSSKIRKSLMVAGLALGVGLAINFSIAFLVYVPRPFEVGIGNFTLPRPRDIIPKRSCNFLVGARLWGAHRSTA